MDTTERPRQLAGLIDVSDLPLAELAALEGNTVFEHSVRRVTAAAGQRPQDSVSAFNSAI